MFLKLYVSNPLTKIMEQWLPVNNDQPESHLFQITSVKTTTFSGPNSVFLYLGQTCVIYKNHPRDPFKVAVVLRWLP
jgi:hypothetical protein